MATTKMDTVIRHLRRVMLRQDGAGWTDGQLLASFIDHKDEAAFEALVRRHGPMVFGVCRRLLHNHHDAEDAFQATFLVLARKASSVRPRERVANWLHGVALRTAMKAKAMTAKRRGREKQVTEMPEPEAVQQDQWRDLQPLLDQELNGLPENYRLPILLCDLEGKTIKDAAQQLGWPQGSVAGRLARGRKLLAKRLANRGVTLSAGSLAAVVAQNAVSAAVPTSLMSTTVKAAAVIAAGQAAVARVVPAKVAILMEGVLKTMFMTKLKSLMPVTMAVLAIMVGVGVGLLGYGRATGQQKEDNKSDAVTPLDKLQGTWVLASAERSGRVLPERTIQALKMTLTIKDDRFTLQFTREDTESRTQEGKLTIDPAKQPETMAWLAVKPGEKNIIGKAVYSADDDTLKLWYGKERPTDFRVRLIPELAQGMFVFKREQADVVAPNKAVAKSDKEQLLGKWLLISCKCNGKERREEPWSKDAPLVIEEAEGKLVCKTVFKDKAKLIETFGDDMEKRMLWADMAGESPAKVIERFGEEMEKNTQGILKLDARTKPKTLDVFYPVAGYICCTGIYKLDGDTLTWCWSKALTPEVAKTGKDRPTDFSTTSGDGRSLLIYKRQKETEPKSRDSSPVPAKKPDAGKTDLDRLQGVWSVVSIERGGKPCKLDKIVFMVDGKRACLQGSDKEMQGGLYLEPASKPKTFDLAMGTRTIEGIYSLEGDTLRLCYGMGSEPKRPGSLLTEKGSQQILLVLKRNHGPEVFPFRLPDGTRAFPTIVEKANTEHTPSPSIAPHPKANKP